MASIDLCNAEDVRKHAQYQELETEHDDVIEALVTRLSRSMLAIREFKPAMGETSRVVAYDPYAPYVSVAPWDLQAVTGLVIDDGLASEQTLTGDGSHWRLADLDPQWRVYGGVELAPSVVVPSSDFESRYVTITGTWGFREVPEDVTEALVLAVIMYLRGEVQAFGSAFQPNSLAEDVNRPLALPPGIRGLLAPYHREVYA